MADKLNKNHLRHKSQSELTKFVPAIGYILIGLLIWTAILTNSWFVFAGLVYFIFRLPFLNSNKFNKHPLIYRLLVLEAFFIVLPIIYWNQVIKEGGTLIFTGLVGTCVYLFIKVQVEKSRSIPEIFTYLWVFLFLILLGYTEFTGQLLILDKILGLALLLFLLKQAIALYLQEFGSKPTKNSLEEIKINLNEDSNSKDLQEEESETDLEVKSEDTEKISKVDKLVDFELEIAGDEIYGYLSVDNYASQEDIYTIKQKVKGILSKAGFKRSILETEYEIETKKRNSD